MTHAYLETGAFTDGAGRYRYTLRRRWEQHGQTICWIMLNPSTADADKDDPTIRRCVGFSKRWGYAGLVVVNLFATRATDPRELRLRPDFYQQEWYDLVGPYNDEAIRGATSPAAASRVIAAWGNHGSLYSRADDIRELVYQPIFHLGLTKQLQPRHPLYVGADVVAQEWA